MTVRVAFGDGSRRLIRQMLTESITLSCCGAILGIVLAIVGTHLFAGLTTFKIPLLASIKMDPASLAFSLLIAVLTGLLSGLVPAIQVPLKNVQDTLKYSGRASSGTVRHVWIHSALVISEIVFACVLLVGAGLLSRSFLKVLQVDMGFQPERAATFRIDHSASYSSKDQREVFLDQVLTRARSMPGISAAGLTGVLPLVGDRSWEITARGKVSRGASIPKASSAS